MFVFVVLGRFVGIGGKLVRLLRFLVSDVSVTRVGLACGGASMFIGGSI